MAYEFHYTPTGTGVISGKEVLEQTEDAINDLGNTAISGVQEALDKAEQALTNSANAVDDAQTALNTANNAEGVAIQAQTDVSNLSGTVTNIGNRVTTAEGNITNLQGRMTTAESGISGLNTRMGTAEGNITTLQSNVSTAQATANSAQQTANTARQQSYVLRYSSSSVTDNSTIAYSTIDNTDNIKTSDKIIDVDGKIFSIVSVDTANQTVTVGAVLLTLALDSNVMHLSGDETVAGQKTLINLLPLKGEFLGPEASNNGRTLLYFIANRDTQNQSGIYLTKFRQNKAQGAMSGNDIAYLSFDCLENSVRTNNVLRINFLNFVDDIPQRFILWSGINERLLGTAVAPWSDVSTDKINGLNPGVLSFPDLSSGLDISAYISVSDGQNILSTYTAPADGWISINLGRASGAIGLIISNGSYSISARDNSFPDSHRECPGILPVFKNDTVSILSNLADSVLSAYFYPCKGNV